jgi:hypothetical protein
MWLVASERPLCSTLWLLGPYLSLYGHRHAAARDTRIASHGLVVCRVASEYQAAILVARARSLETWCCASVAMLVATASTNASSAPTKAGRCVPRRIHSTSLSGTALVLCPQNGPYARSHADARIGTHARPSTKRVDRTRSNPLTFHGEHNDNISGLFY